VRLFIGCFPPPELQELIFLAGESWRRLPTAKPVPRQNIHLTLAFIGEQPAATANNLAASLQTSLRDARSVQCMITSPNGFPRPDKARVGVFEATGSGLHDLAKRAASAGAAAGVTVEDRKFHPHLTVARFRKPQALPQSKDLNQSWLIGSVALVESRLSSQGASYSVIEEVPLQE
jgi:RNA 2',3'-cyclic 3'-phosphodiesterase